MPGPTITDDTGGDLFAAYGQDQNQMATVGSTGGQTQSSQDPAIYWGPYVQPAKGVYPYTPSPPVVKGGSRGGRGAKVGGGTVVRDDGGLPPSPDYYSQVPTAYTSQDQGPAQGAYPEDYEAKANTVSGADQWLFTLRSEDEEAFLRLGHTLFDLGYFGDKKSPTESDIFKAWHDIAGLAAAHYSTGQNLTMNQVMYLHSPALFGKGDDLFGNQTGEDKLAPTTLTESMANVYSFSEAKHLARDVAQSELGRDLTDGELDRFAMRLMAAQAAQPETRTTTTTPGVDALGAATGDASRSQVTHGGIDPQTFATDQLRANPDYAEHQAAAFYMPALLQALGATTGASA
jgi:hypothetical protein